VTRQQQKNEALAQLILDEMGNGYDGKKITSQMTV